MGNTEIHFICFRFLSPCPASAFYFSLFLFSQSFPFPLLLSLDLSSIFFLSLCIFYQWSAETHPRISTPAACLVKHVHVTLKHFCMIKETDHGGRTSHKQLHTTEPLNRLKVDWAETKAEDSPTHWNLSGHSYTVTAATQSCHYHTEISKIYKCREILTHQPV